MKHLILSMAFAAVTLSVAGQSLKRALPDSVILKADRIIETDSRQFFRNVQSLIVYDNGAVVFEKYYHGAERDSLHQIQSQTKSIVALLMGIAIDRGFVSSQEEAVSAWFPEHFNAGDPLKAKVTIRDLLTMSAGFEWEEMIPFDDPRNDNMSMYRSGHWLEYALTRGMKQEPFTGFTYNSGCPMIVAGIIEKASGRKLDEFAQEYLFEPLGIDRFRWLKDSTGFCHAGGGLFLRRADMLKIGILVLNEGKWGEQQVIPGQWISKITKPAFATGFDTSRYGYFWWLREMRTGSGKNTPVYSAEGAGGQKIYIFPEYRLVVGLTEQNYSTPQVGPVFIRESVLPVL